MAEPERRRRRPPVSCSLCRRRKIKCNREHPCSNCLRSKTDDCVYERLSPPPQRANYGPTDVAPAHSRVSNVTSSSGPKSPNSQASSVEVESLRLRIKELEEQLSRTTQRSVGSSAPSPNFDISTMTSHIAGTVHVHQELAAAGQLAVSSRTTIHKNRMFGQSHWFNSASHLLEILDLINPVTQDETSKAVVDLKKCKYLARVIKSRWTPPWPTQPTTDLPSKEVADTLVEAYLRTFETVYRILHVPTFRRDYDALWISDTSPDMGFLIQVKLVLAIGAAMHDDHFSMRESATRWVQEAQTWIAEPKFKSRLDLQFLQTSLLLLIPQELLGVDRGQVWISAGSIFRMAVYMGLHRDPSFLPRRSTYVTEMRRRLWSTILETALQTSIESGAPPLFSLEDFDAHPPGNFDDDQILTEDPVPKPAEQFTQMSTSLALRQMLPHRLAIVKSLNNIGAHNTYEETLRLDSDLRTAYKSVCRTLQRNRFNNTNSPLSFETRTLDFLVRRYLLALHTPVYMTALHETTYAFSRKVVVEAALAIWCTIHPSSLSVMTAHPQDQSPISESDDIRRLALSGVGPLGTISIHTCVLIAAELKAQLQEEGGLGLVPLRRDLLAVLYDAKEWTLRCIEAGQTNIKGHLLISLLSAQIDEMMRGLPMERFPQMLIKAAEDAEARCLAILEAKASPGQDETWLDFDGLDEISAGTLPDFIGDWSFLMSGGQFDVGVTEPMNCSYGAFD